MSKMLTELTETQIASNDDYLMLFNSTNGARKIKVGKIGGGGGGGSVAIVSLLDSVVTESDTPTPLNDDISNYDYFIIGASMGSTLHIFNFSQFTLANYDCYLCVMESPSVYVQGVANISSSGITLTGAHASGWSSMKITEVYGVKL